MESKHVFGEDVGKCIMNTAHQIKFSLNSIFEQAGLTGLQARILGFVRFNSENGRDIFQKDIEAEFKIRRSSVSSVLDNMEKNGFISRQSVESDARLKKIVLTEKAQDISKQHYQTILRFENSLLENMTADEIATLKSLLSKVAENIEGSEV
ncbi:MAG: winged helix-turn-helix transcriptional regulator [Ruminococcaceae bacterium]|nr:winged helix-turn-helix transcriptional regulator [Oscillospiraceae bacterium]